MYLKGAGGLLDQMGSDSTTGLTVPGEACALSESSKSCLTIFWFLCNIQKGESVHIEAWLSVHRGGSRGSGDSADRCDFAVEVPRPRHGQRMGSHKDTKTQRGTRKQTPSQLRGFVAPCENHIFLMQALPAHPGLALDNQIRGRARWAESCETKPILPDESRRPWGTGPGRASPGGPRAKRSQFRG